MKLKDKVAIVTGAGRGIGKAIAKKLAAEGAAVMVNALHAETAGQVAREIQDDGGKALAFIADVSKKDQVHALVQNTLENFGIIHILVNNAGKSHYSPIIDFKEEDWDLTQSINLKSVFLCTQAVLGHMIKQKFGKVINISSSTGLANSIPGTAAYGAAKAGVMAFTKIAAREAGPYGINVNCIVPGTIITELTYARPKQEAEQHIEAAKKVSVLGRVGDPDDIANLALFLASKDSDFMTGQVIRMDGGRADLI